MTTQVVVWLQLPVIAGVAVSVKFIVDKLSTLLMNVIKEALQRQEHSKQWEPSPCLTLLRATNDARGWQDWASLTLS